MRHNHLKTLFAVAISLSLSACGSFVRDSAPNTHVDHTRVPNAVPKPEPFSKYGNPDSYVVFGKTYSVLESASGYTEEGVASWYGTKFHGKRTSSGEPYNMYAMTAAHKTLPIPVYVEVTHRNNGRKVIVRVNDRGPFVDDRIIDLSYVAAKKLGITEHGTAPVSIRVIDPLNPQPAPPTRIARPEPAETESGVLIMPVATGGEIDQTPISPPVAIAPLDPLPATNQSTTPAGLVYLQVGAFSEHANAAKLLQRLVLATTENVIINRLLEGARQVYRVRIGPLASEADVQRIRSELSSLGFAAAHVVVE